MVFLQQSIMIGKKEILRTIGSFLFVHSKVKQLCLTYLTKVKERSDEPIKIGLLVSVH